MNRFPIKKSLFIGFMALVCGQSAAVLASPFDDLVRDLSTNLYVTTISGAGMVSVNNSIDSRRLQTKVGALAGAFSALPLAQRKAYGYGVAFAGGAMKPNAQLQGLIDQIMKPVIAAYPISSSNPGTDLGISAAAKNIRNGAVLPGVYALIPYFN